MTRRIGGVPWYCAIPFLGMPAFAQTDAAAEIAALKEAVRSAQSAGDNAWMLTSAALVLLMTGPGLALAML